MLAAFPTLESVVATVLGVGGTKAVEHFPSGKNLPHAALGGRLDGTTEGVVLQREATRVLGHEVDCLRMVDLVRLAAFQIVQLSHELVLLAWRIETDARVVHTKQKIKHPLRDVKHAAHAPLAAQSEDKGGRRAGELHLSLPVRGEVNLRKPPRPRICQRLLQGELARLLDTSKSESERCERVVRVSVSLGRCLLEKIDLPPV